MQRQLLYYRFSHRQVYREGPYTSVSSVQGLKKRSLAGNGTHVEHIIVCSAGNWQCAVCVCVFLSAPLTTIFGLNKANT